MSKNTSGPAFPVIPPLSGGVNAPGYPFPGEGMTLRDYFAAKAMYLAFQEEVAIKDVDVALGLGGAPYNPEKHWPEYVAKRAYAYADAMLAEREKE